MHVTPVMWLVTLAVIIVVFAFDLVVIGRRPHVPSMKECGLAIALFCGLAVVFGGWIWFQFGHDFGTQFFAGWLTEYSLSVDNLFIFVIIMASLRVPSQLQQFALMVGIVLALVFRGIFIALGAALIERFSWVFFIFGAFLIYTAVKLYLEYRSDDNSEGEPTDNALLRFVKKVFRATDDYRGTKLLTRIDHRTYITPMFVVIVALGSTDLLFALDSIPAIYGLTQEPYLVFTANVFALMGLRQLYFLIGGLLERLVYLSVGLAVVLAFIGVKLVLHAMHEYHLDAALGFSGEIPTWLSLIVIVVTLAVTTVASLLKSRRAATGASDAPVSDGSEG
ncbi:MAG: TerC family protein [Propionibacteriaceae bacterium]|jgi:tellurite resistance protein TerC|nr:TerC family protein [Propionibacteriaceae bacterium]